MNINAQALLRAAKALAQCSSAKRGYCLDNVNLEVTETGIRLTATDGYVLHRTFLPHMGGIFPNCEQSIPTSFVGRLTVNREKFIKLLKATSDRIVALTMTEECSLSLSNGEDAPLVLSQNAATFLGEWPRITFTVKLLLPIVQALEAEEITLCSSGQLSVCRITSAVNPDEDPTFFVIMPTRQ